MEEREYIQGQNVARRVLRKEVGFGCPICRKPFLTYHHFNPPWREQHHWNPDGMIALCREHHDKAEGGHYTKDALRALKSASYSVSDVQEHFPWARTDFVIRVGGLYSCGSHAVIRIDTEPVIQIRIGEEGLLCVSFVLRATDGTIVVQMDENFFQTGSTAPFDLVTTTTATRITVWHEPRRIGMDVSLNQVTPEELDAKLTADRQRQNEKLALVNSQIQNRLEESLRHLPPEFADRIREDNNSMMTPQSPEETSRRVAKFRKRFGASELPDHLLQTHFSGDPVGHRVKTWAAANCMDSDGNIAFLDFNNLLVHGRDRQIRIHDGVGSVDYDVAINCATAFAL